MKKKITVDLSTLRDLLASVAPFASSETHMPMINAVELRGTGTFLVAAATDRYAIGVKRAAVPDVDGFYALLPLADAKHLLSTFKVPRGDGAAAVTLEVADERMRVTRAEGMFAGCYDLSAEYLTLDARTFPSLLGLMAAWEPGDTPMTAYNPSLLAKFQAVGERNEPIRILHGKAKRPSLVLSGDNFCGAVMPVTGAVDAAPVLDPREWIAALQPVKAVTK